MGLLTGHWFLKFNLLMVNITIFVALKIIMIESSQTRIIRDLSIINLVFFCYILTYTFAGYPWLIFCLYFSVIMERIVYVHFLFQLSPTLHNSIGVLFNDPENLDELVRLNISD